MVAAYAALNASNQLLWLTFAPITTAAARHYHVTANAVGWLAEAFPLMYVVTAIPTGRLLDRWFRPMLAAGAVLNLLGALIRLAGHGFGSVLAGQLVVALAQPLLLNAVTRLSNDNLPAADRANGIAVGSAGIFLGMLAALVLGSVFGGSGIHVLLLIGALWAAVSGCGMLLALRRPAPFGTTAAAPAASPPPPATAAEPAAQPAPGLRAVCADRYLQLLFAMVFIGFGVFISLTTWLQTLLAPAGVSDTSAGVLLVIMVIAGIAGSVLVPLWVNRHRRPILPLVLSLVVTTLGCSALAGDPRFDTGVPVTLAIGFFLVADLPIVLELAERRAGSAAATVTGLIWMAGNAGGLVVALVVQTMLHHPAGGLLLMAAVTLAGLPLLTRLAHLEEDPGRSLPENLAGDQS